MRALVTGGGGFLGTAIVRQLIERGDEVVSFSRSRYPHLDELGAKQIQGDVAEADAVNAAAEGCDMAFHVAGKVGLAGTYQSFYWTNAVGTENVIAACRYHNIKKLVYTSSPSVVFDGKDMEGVDESVPYPTEFEAHYPKTKCLGEQAALRANEPILATVALRPHLVWGPGDNQLLPRIVQRARQGRLRQIGDGKNMVDTVYVDNAAEAHLLAADKLEPGSAIAGKAYFISNDEPIALWEMVNRMLQAAGAPTVNRRVSTGFAVGIGAVLEKAYGLLGIDGEPPMTRFLARELATAHWFDISAAKRDLGYAPRVSIEEGLRRLEEWCKSHPV